MVTNSLALVLGIAGLLALGGSSGLLLFARLDNRLGDYTFACPRQLAIRSLLWRIVPVSVERFIQAGVEAGLELTGDRAWPLRPHDLPEGDDWRVDLLLGFLSFLSRFFLLLLYLLDLLDIFLDHLFELWRMSLHFTKSKNTSPDSIDRLGDSGSFMILIVLWDW